MSRSSPDASNLRRPHPLAEALIVRLGGRSMRVLDVGAGSGRNTAALRAAGFDVTSVPDTQIETFEPGGAPFDGAIGTHAFLHGTPATVAGVIARTARALKPQAPFYATFASKRDARYGKGSEIARDTFAPESGDEAGVAHAYFDEISLRQMLAAHFEIETLSEEDVDAIVGRWAHAQRPSGSVHWFLRARKRQ